MHRYGMRSGMRKDNYDKETCEYCRSISKGMSHKFGWCMKTKRKVGLKDKYGCFN